MNIMLILKQLIFDTQREIIFMIGVGFMRDNQWYFKNFIVNSLTDNEEKRIAYEFIKFVGSGILIHWSNAEKSIFNRLLLKYPELNSNTEFDIESNSDYGARIKFKWFDLYQYFIDEQIVIKGAFNF
jgi:hypothetical protein